MRHFTILMVAIILVGCGSDRPAKPDNLISQEKMSDIMYDVFLLNAAKGINKRILENNGVFPQEYVFEKYNIDSLQFVKSNEYYAYDTKTYESILVKVKQKIEVEKANNEAVILKEEKKSDSIKEARKKDKTTDTLQKSMKLKFKDSISPSKNTDRQI